MRRRTGSMIIAIATVCGAVAFGAPNVGASPTSDTEAPVTIEGQSAAAEASPATESSIDATSVPASTLPQDGVQNVSDSTSTAAPATTEEVGPDGLTDSQRELIGENQGPVANGDLGLGQRGPAFQVTPIPPPPVTIPVNERLPENSGNGRRIVYHKTRQRVWLVDDDNTVVKTHLVSGRLTWNQPSAGQYAVFSRSRWTCAIGNPAVCWPFMVRFTYGPGGLAIGFHEIPTNRATGRKLQSISELGTPRSAGCVRQAPADAAFLWDWAPIGTKVVVIQ